MKLAIFLKCGLLFNSLYCLFCFYIKLYGAITCRVKTNITWTTKNIMSSRYFSKNQYLARSLKAHENLWIGNKQFSGKNDVISIENSTFHELQVFIELIFRYNFQFSVFILEASSKWCLIFYYFSAVFEK